MAKNKKKKKRVRHHRIDVYPTFTDEHIGGGRIKRRGLGGFSLI